MRDLRKLKAILENEVKNGLLPNNISLVKFETIIQMYNEGMPIYSKIMNTSKNRKMIFSNIVRYSKKCIQQKARIHENRGLNDDEQSALDVLTNLEHFILQDVLSLENEHLNVDKMFTFDSVESITQHLMDASKNEPNKTASDVFKSRQLEHLSVDEISAIHALMSLSDDVEIVSTDLPTPKLEQVPMTGVSSTDVNQNETLHTPNISKETDYEFQGESNITNVKEHGEYQKDSMANIENILANFVNQLKGMFEKLFDQYNFQEINNNKKCDRTISCNNNNICNIPNVDITSIKNDCSINESFENILNKSNKTLGSFEISNNSLKVEEFESYRKTPNQKEKLNRDVNRSTGVATKRTRTFKKSVLDCKFEINPKHVFNAKDNQKLKLSKNKIVLDVIKQEYSKVNNACIISFYSTKVLKSGLLLYGYCNFLDCSKYRFKINKNGEVFVNRTGEIFHAKGEKRVAQMRGVARKIAKKTLSKTSAYLYRKDQILNAADDIAKSGNLQNVQSLPVVRKCKSEGNSDKWLHPNAFYEIILMKEGAYKDYIQYAASPLSIYCWGKATFITFAVNPTILKDANYTIHFDASGQSVRQIECAEKRILIYKMVIRIKKFKMVIPIITAILSRHTLNDICAILEKLKLYCIENKFKWPFFERVCTDVSYALFGAVLKCCNNENLSQYLLSCFRYLELKEKVKRPKVIVQWCKSHYIHIMSKDLNNKIGKHSILRHLLKHVLTLAFDLKTIQDSKSWFRHLFVVLLFPKKNHIFEESLNILRKNILQDNETDFEYQSMLDDDDCNLESIASRSPFKKLFLRIFNGVCTDIQKLTIIGDDNEYKNEEMCNFIINKYCPFIPMWTNIMGILIDPSGNHLSNAPVEFSFFLQKHILLNQRSVRPGDFIKIDRKDNISTLKDLRYRYNMFEEIKNENEKRVTLESGKQILEENDCQLLQIEESWNKKDPRKQKAINPKHLNANKVKKFITPTKDVQDVIKTEPDDLLNSSRINKEHSYSDLSKSLERKNEKIHYYLFRYNNLYNLFYPKLKQLEIGFYNFLDSEDWDSLKERSRLTNFVVDCAILSFIKENSKQVLSLPCQINEINFEKVKKLISLKPDMLFIPILKNDHFNLCVLRPALREFLFIDSLYDNTGESHFNEFKTNASRNETWKYVNILQRTKQDDGVSCGIFVILYVICLLKDKPMTNLPIPNKFRNEIKSVLIKYADDCSKFCCHCGNSRKNRKKCSLCNYGVCKDCIIKNYNDFFTTCKICSKNIMQ